MTAMRSYRRYRRESFFRSIARGAIVLAALIFAGAGNVGAETPPDPAPPKPLAEHPGYSDLPGNYLAGRFAYKQRDVASAAKFYQRILEEDHENPALMRRALMLTVQDGRALIEFRPETGRTHQVRVHCASIGHALLGDPVYGRTPKSLRALLEDLGFRRQALHAARLGFRHPISAETLDFCAELPSDMRELIDETAR